MTKMHVLHCRVNTQEKEMLEKRAAQLCMSNSQYIRFRLLSENDATPNQSIKWLDQHYKLVMRLIVTIYWQTKGLANNSLSAEMHQTVEDNINELYQILGITREDNSHGSNGKINQ